MKGTHNGITVSQFETNKTLPNDYTEAELTALGMTLRKREDILLSFAKQKVCQEDTIENFTGWFDKNERKYQRKIETAAKKATFIMTHDSLLITKFVNESQTAQNDQERQIKVPPPLLSLIHI